MEYGDGGESAEEAAPVDSGTPAALHGAMIGATAASGARRLGRLLLDAVLPARCLGCGAVVSAPGALCAGCWAGLRFLGPPHCACCGYPFAFAPGEGDALCGGCLRARPAFRQARAVLAYDAASRGMLLAFKHGDRTDAAPAFGAWLARAGAPLLAEAELVVPVPLHWSRLFSRRYNQSALLALAVGRLAGLPVAPDLIVRRRRTRSQGGLGRAGRRRNVQGAFAVPRRRRARLAGRHVLLVDDVYTTGATADACARALLQAGAAAVDLLTLARVVRPEV